MVAGGLVAGPVGAVVAGAVSGAMVARRGSKDAQELAAGGLTPATTSIPDHRPVLQGSRLEQGSLVRFHDVPVHRFCERWLYRYGGDSAEQLNEQKRAPFRVVPAAEVDSDHQVTILDWHETKGKGELFVEYRIRVQAGDRGPSWDVWHRYSDFEKLHEKLVKNGEAMRRGVVVPLRRRCCAPLHMHMHRSGAPLLRLLLQPRGL